jgi:DNA-binding winged helix-turn-helix (wHTH) protein/TolB-like protein
MDEHAKVVYQFGPFRYDADAKLLFRGDKLVSLQPKVAETLQVLLEHRGSLVEKAYLMRCLWPDTRVEEIGLARNISLLRKALGENNESSAYVETLSKRGYRFVAKVDMLPGDGGPAQVQELAASPRRPRYRRLGLAAVVLLGLGIFVYWQFYRPSRYLPPGSDFARIAVIPYECLSPELGCGAFTRGLDDLLVADLSKLEKVHVTSPATVLRYQRARLSSGFMARVLGLEVLLEGTIQRAGEHVRITSRLVDVHSGTLIWSDSYEYHATESSQAQVDAARLIAAHVGAHLAIRYRGVPATH